MASAVGSFVSNIWKVHRPLFEQEGYEAEPVVDDKPPAKLPDAAEVSDEARANIKNDDDAKQVGVAIAEATYALTGKTWYIMMASLIVAYFVFALDNITTSSYLYTSVTQVNGSFNDYYTAAAIQGVIVGVAKLVIGKLADIYGRFSASIITLFFYVLGFLILAVSQNADTQIAGIAFQSIGNSGLQIVMWVIMADFLSARMRAFAKKSGLVPVHPYLRHGFLHGAKEFIMDADIGGMVLVLVGFIFILLPLNRGGNPSFQAGSVAWKTPWIIALFVVGGVCLIALPFYEIYVSPRPFIRRRWLNSDVVLAMVIAFFDFMTFNISFQMLFHDLGMRQIQAYNDAAEHALWAGIVFCAFVLICSLFVKDWILPRSQNVVSDELPEKNPFRMASDNTYDGAVEQVEKSNVVPPSYNEFPHTGENVVSQANENVVQQGKEKAK
ncbi:uncharacterized protein MJAP1_000689 [Malassezia japonica]|uniref:Uncharacterized protein n=1 Tax=Malassezia japonica TaxID=223818 RepID=A0AAF0EZN5_9BASI|nr:uncharacterized protein MJAP1_000689 [Malassezia japonica]WFD37742.1 hypothetical protein MJAP1_000689 [Malassezia japonica]